MRCARFRLCTLNVLSLQAAGYHFHAQYWVFLQESDRRRKHESARRSGSNALQVLGLQAANTTASVAAVSGASIGSNSSSTNGSASLESNQYLAELPRFKTPRVLEMRARGGRCFDFDYYLSANPELLGVVGESKEEVWRHFVYYGQFEARPFRYVALGTGENEEGLLKLREAAACAAVHAWVRADSHIHAYMHGFGYGYGWVA